MKYNINLLKKYSVLYVNTQKYDEVLLKPFKELFKHIIIANDIKKATLIYEKLFSRLDLIIYESDELLENSDFLSFLKSRNEKLPTIIVTNNLDNSLLNHLIQFNISAFLLKPLKVQDLSKMAAIKIQEFHKKNEVAKSLISLKKELDLTNSKMELLSNKYKNKANQLDFYEYLHNKFLSFIRINKVGLISHLSQDLKHKFDDLQNEFDKDIKSKNISEIFETPIKIQKALISSLKERTIIEVDDFILFKNKEEKRVIVVPNFDEKTNEEYRYTLFILSF